MNFLTVVAAQYLVYVIALISLYIFVQLDTINRKRMLIFGILSAVFALILTKTAGYLYFDPRPFVSGNFVPLIPHPADNGFPSDHTVLALVAASTVLRFNRTIGVVLIVLSLLLGFARVHAGIHSPLDIFGSVFIAFISVELTTLFVSKKISRHNAVPR